MSKAITVRDACPDDLSSITGIYAHAVENGVASFELVAPDEAEISARYEALVRNDYPYLVATTNDWVIGYAYASSFRPRPAYRWSVENSVYIAPDMQGQGIGKALLSRLIVECEKRGYRQMLAVIGGAEHVASIKLHESLGFTHAGQLTGVGWKHGKWQASVMMQRPLGKGEEAPPEE